ncbi:hypothetical protein BT96DRAFT_1021129 [Gymnopus androsaceus JB14]|uniref:Uncharacterized protein n=1 Tax=Gymnopus androsaceus JB14 TaxID=1447944 RepID=A0A6A4HEG6_9AGAR|nr:hypothetical protein BT96DRAFT_1021129 [Gymnopus androsaceus JB14]
MFSTLSFVLLCVYFPRILYAAPNPQQSASLIIFGGDDGDSDSAVTEFLIPSGTSSGGQTTFEFVEVESVTLESTSGTATVTISTVATFSGQLVASTSGFALDDTVTETILGSAITLTEQANCHATASDSGECDVVINGATLTSTGTASTQLIAVSASTFVRLWRLLALAVAQAPPLALLLAAPRTVDLKASTTRKCWQSLYLVLRFWAFVLEGLWYSRTFQCGMGSDILHSLRY